MQNCKLCQNNSNLKNSHIIPRSIYKSLKKGSGQLLKLSVNDPLQAKISNSNPTEKLLCGSCEQLLSQKYESYGTRLLKEPKRFKNMKTGLIIKSFKYNKFYLYLISILWRASVSDLQLFKSVDLGLNLNNYLRQCIYKGSRKLSTSIKLDHVVRISMIKLIDPTDEIPPDIMRKLLIYITKETHESQKNTVLYYFVIDGFLIIYYLKVWDDIHKLRTEVIAAQLTNNPQVFVPKVDYRTFKFLNEAMNTIAVYNSQK